MLGEIVGKICNSILSKVEDNLSFKRIGKFPQGREAIRMMQKMGMNLETVENVNEVLIKTDEKSIVIEDPEVSVIRMKGQIMYQISGGSVREMVEEVEETPSDDAKIVAEQTGCTIEEAREALNKADGDLAKAILILKKT